MESIGIKRHMDDLGRVVIPKEFRKQIGIDAGDPFEISLSVDKEIVIKKSETLDDSYIDDILETCCDDICKYRASGISQEELEILCSKCKIAKNVQQLKYIR